MSVNWENFISIPIAGGVIAYLYKKLNNKVGRSECTRIHDSLEQRLNDMHSDIKMIKRYIIEGVIDDRLDRAG